MILQNADSDSDSDSVFFKKLFWSGSGFGFLTKLEFDSDSDSIRTKIMIRIRIRDSYTNMSIRDSLYDSEIPTAGEKIRLWFGPREPKLTQFCLPN